MIIVCRKCGLTWDYQGKARYVSCPNKKPKHHKAYTIPLTEERKKIRREKGAMAIRRMSQDSAWKEKQNEARRDTYRRAYHAVKRYVLADLDKLLEAYYAKTSRVT